MPETLKRIILTENLISELMFYSDSRIRVCSLSYVLFHLISSDSEEYQPDGNLIYEFIFYSILSPETLKRIDLTGNLISELMCYSDSRISVCSLSYVLFHFISSDSEENRPDGKPDL